MSNRERVVDPMESLPTDTPLTDVTERLLFMAKLERGIGEADAGLTISHEELLERMAKYLF